jgi:hypothetical protein
MPSLLHPSEIEHICLRSYDCLPVSSLTICTRYNTKQKEPECILHRADRHTVPARILGLFLLLLHAFPYNSTRHLLHRAIEREA